MQGGNKRVLGIVLFVVMGASALILGIINAGKSIGGPLKLSGSLANGSSQAQAEALLRSKDTDEDGLSDYDELNVTHSSAYIKDSDSDGLDDGTEVREGTDPNCPKGQNCGVPAPIAEDKTNANVGADPAGVSGGGSGLSAGGTLPVASAANIAQIRAFLKEQGLSDEVLSAIDDQTLINMYNEALPSSSGSNVNQ